MRVPFGNIHVSAPVFSIQWDSFGSDAYFKYRSQLQSVKIHICDNTPFTTALANGFSLIQNFEKKKGGKLFIKIFLTLWGIAAAQIGFSAFIEHVYPFFGIIGLFEGIMIIRAAIRKA